MWNILAFNPQQYYTMKYLLLEKHDFAKILIIGNNDSLLAISYSTSLLSKLGVWPMVEPKPLGCHSRENGNPEPKYPYSWIPASAGMTNLKGTNLIFRNLKNSGKCQENDSSSPQMGLIWTAMILHTVLSDICLSASPTHLTSSPYPLKKSTNSLSTFTSAMNLILFKLFLTDFSF